MARLFGARLAPAIIVALGLIVAGFLAGGRFTMHVIDPQTVLRLDRWTGDVTMCVVAVAGSSDSCGWALDLAPASADNDTPPASLTDEQMQALEDAGVVSETNSVKAPE